HDRESVWRAVRRGQSGVRSLRGLTAIPDDLLLGAPVDIDPEYPGQLKPITLLQRVATEAIDDAQVDWSEIDRTRFGCAISGHMGDDGFITEYRGRVRGSVPWWHQWLPNTACSMVANRYGMWGPRISHSTACASGLVDILSAVRSIQDDQCDI